MNTKTRYKRHDKGGFTMIEIIIVVGLISVLTFVLSSNYKSVYKYVNSSAEEQMLNRLNESANRWLHLKMQSGEMGVSPADLGTSTAEALNALLTPISINGHNIDSGLSSKITLEYIEKLHIEFDSAEGEFKRIER